MLNEFPLMRCAAVSDGAAARTIPPRPSSSLANLFTVLRNKLKCGSSVVECRTRNRESPGSNHLCYRFEVWAFSFSSRRLSRLSCINEYLAIDSGGSVSE